MSEEVPLQTAEKLNKHMHGLLRFGDLFNACVVVTNRLWQNLTPSLGSHKAGRRAYSRAHGNLQALPAEIQRRKRIIRLVDSPSLPKGKLLLQ
jgi:DNA repair protein RadA